MESIVRELVVIRKQKNITQEELASRMQVSRTVLARVECGKSSPKLVTVEKIAAALHLSLCLKEKTNTDRKDDTYGNTDRH